MEINPKDLSPKDAYKLLTGSVILADWLDFYR